MEHRAATPIQLLGLVLLCAASATPLGAQSISGRVIDQVTGRPVPVAAVTLQGRDGTRHVQVLTDELGRFLVTAPSAGEYYLRAAALGYEPTESPLLAVPDSGQFPVDVEVHPAPLGLDPLVVTAQRYEDWVHQVTGLNPRSVLGKVMASDDWRDLALRGRDLVEAIRFANLPGATVERRSGGLCIGVGRVECVPIYVDGVPWSPADVVTLDLDAIDAVIYLKSQDGTTLFEHRGHFNQRDARASGALMIFRKGFIRP